MASAILISTCCSMAEALVPGGSSRDSPSLKSEPHESIKVLVRVRPLNENELLNNSDSSVELLGDKSLNVTSADGRKSFNCAYDAVLGPSSSQSDVYDVVRTCTSSVLDGFNSTIFAYGQTGSGKVTSSGHFKWKLSLTRSPHTSQPPRPSPCTDLRSQVGTRLVAPPTWWA